MLTQAIIDARGYEDIRDTDGWETLERTVRQEHTEVVADYILVRLKATTAL